METTFWESFKAESAEVTTRLRTLIKQGNLRRVVIDHKGRTVAEFPLTAGVVGMTLAPVLAAIGALVALLNDCTVHVELLPAGVPRSTPAARDHAADDVEC